MGLKQPNRIVRVCVWVKRQPVTPDGNRTTFRRSSEDPEAAPMISGAFEVGFRCEGLLGSGDSPERYDVTSLSSLGPPLTGI